MSFFRENIGLKLIALLLAIIFEVQFYSQSVSETVTAVVEVRGVPENLTIVSPSSATSRGVRLRVRVRGPAPVVDSLAHEQHKYFVDIPSDVEDSFVEVVRPEKVRFQRGGAGITVLDVVPSVIKFEFEEVIRKELLVTVPQTGRPIEGYHVKRIDVRPVSVVATGPRSELDGVVNVETRPLNLTKFDKTKKVDIALQPIGAMTHLDVNVVTLDVQIAAIKSERRFKSMNIEVLAPKGFAATLEPSRAQVTVVGPKGLLNNLSESEIRLVADGRELEEGKHDVLLEARLPKGLSLLEAKPATATITLVTN